MNKGQIIWFAKDEKISDGLNLMISIDFEIESESYMFQTKVRDEMCSLLEKSLDELEMKVTRCQLVLVEEDTLLFKRETNTYIDDIRSRLEVSVKPLGVIENSELENIMTSDAVIERVWDDIFNSSVDHVVKYDNLAEFKKYIKVKVQTKQECYLNSFARLFTSQAPTLDMLPHC